VEQWNDRAIAGEYGSRERHDAVLVDVVEKSLQHTTKGAQSAQSLLYFPVSSRSDDERSSYSKRLRPGFWWRSGARGQPENSRILLAVGLGGIKFLSGRSRLSTPLHVLPRGSGALHPGTGAR
jgi:hypothetical protein